jgi:hypothetical protein
MSEPTPALNRGLWTVVATSIAVGTGIVIGAQMRGSATAQGTRDLRGPQFQLAQGPLGVSPPPGTNAPRPFSGERMPEFIRGTILSIDTTDGRLTVTADGPGGTPQPGGIRAPQTVVLARDTRIIRRVSSAPSELKLGDRIQVSGQPMQMDVTDLQYEPDPNLLMPLGGPSPGGGAAPAGPGASPIGRAAALSRVQVSGEVVNVHPLRVTLSGGVQCSLNVRPEIKVSRLVIGQASDLKAGDTVVGYGSRQADGTVRAEQLSVGMFGMPGRGAAGGTSQFGR